MIKNYLKTALRNFLRNKSSSIINVGGLAIGMTVAILISLWIYDETSYEKFHGNYGRIAKVIQNVTNNGEVQTWTSVPYPLAEELRKNYGEDFKHVVMTSGYGNQVLALGDKKLNEIGFYIEPEGLEMFTLRMVKGNWKSLDDPTSIIISESTARSFFGNEDAIGKVLKLNNQNDLKVSGVFQDYPRNSDFSEVKWMASWQFFANFPDGIKDMDDPWRPNAFHLYVEIKGNADFKKVSARIKDAKLRKVNARLAKKKPELFLNPMSRWHLYSEFKNGVNIGGRIQYVWMFGIIGVFVLLLACINFMNLSTARSEKRAREVGIRKTIGSLRRQIIVQFFAESWLTVVIAFALSLMLAWIFLPSFNLIADKAIVIPWSRAMFWVLAFLVIAITGGIAGSYPAFYLSSFKPVKVLKGTFKAGKFAAIPRKILVVLQFTVSVTLIIGTIIVYQQIQYARNRPVGYTREGLVMASTGNQEIHNHFDAVKGELIAQGAIVNMAESGSPTTDIYSSTSGLEWRGKDPNLSTDFGNIDVSYDYGKTVGWQFLQGRDFSREFQTDSTALVLNEAAANYMGFKNPVGEQVTWFVKKYNVVGVVKNMVMNSPYDEPKPTIFSLQDEPTNFAILRINPKSSARDAVNKIETVFKKYNPEQPFQSSFADDEYNKKFGNEQRIGKLAAIFATLAILISCLGLFGLASFVAEQRTKEIGVRKVLGASVFNVWNLMSKDFMMLVIISFFIAIPTSYYFMHKWLQNYTYRTNIAWWVFLVAGIGAMLITLLTVSYQSIRAALKNPVTSLRTE